MSTPVDDPDLAYAIAQSLLDLERKYVDEKKEVQDNTPPILFVKTPVNIDSGFAILNEYLKKLEKEMRTQVPFFGSTDWAEQLERVQCFLKKFESELSDLKKQVETLSAWCMQNNIADYSTEGVSLLKGKIILEGFDILKESIEETKQYTELWNARFMRSNLPFIFSRVLDSLNTCEFCNIFAQNKAPLIVLSIGSGGQKTQQYPQFVKDCEAEVWNIDPRFAKEQVELGDKHVTVHGYAAKFPINPLWQSPTGGVPFKMDVAIATTLQKSLEHILENPQRKLVLLNHCSGYLPSIFFEIGKKHGEKLGAQLEIIGNYFTELPTVVYHKLAFQHSEYKSFLERMNPFWACVFSSQPISLSTVQTQYPVESFGKIYQNLNQLLFIDLFQKDKLKNLSLTK